MLVHSYARFSDPSQSLGDSERRQVEAAQEFCKRRGYTLSDLSYFDRGRSGFRGDKQKALKALLKAIKAGKIKSGELLLVEAVDRLSRKGIRPTQDLINSILNAGVHIAILTPVEKIYWAHDENDIGGAIELAAFAYQAHLYSELLSGRLKSYWVQARREYKEGKRQTLSAITPAWLTKEGDEYKVKPEALPVIKYIFERTIAGIGGSVLTRELNEKFKPIGRAKAYNKTFVRDVVRERTVLGEYTPHALDDEGKRQPVGDTIKDFYPAVTDEKTWLAANGAMDNRTREKGPTGNFLNLFTGLVHNVVDDSPMHIYTYSQKRATGRRHIYRRLKSYKATSGVKGSCTATVDLPFFEWAFLEYVKQLDLSAFSDEATDNLDLAAKQAELGQKQKRAKDLQAQLKGDTPLDLILEPLRELQEEIAALEQEVRELASQSQRNPKDAVSTLQALAQDPTDRQKLREAIKQAVKIINIAPYKTGKLKRSPVACAVEIVFHAGHSTVLGLLEKQVISLHRAKVKDLLKVAKRLPKWIGGGIHKELTGSVVPHLITPEIVAVVGHYPH